jgi:hypothetical protein
MATIAPRDRSRLPAQRAALPMTTPFSSVAMRSDGASERSCDGIVVALSLVHDERTQSISSDDSR